ncbi:iron-sulfur protein [Burkholderia cepacia]|nr:iron-sulfur protein [Burkholderia cepacia]
MDTLVEAEASRTGVDGETMHLLVRQIRFEGKGINSYELVDPSGVKLPPFEAGAHIDIYLNNGMIRQYSLCNPSFERSRYVIGVLKDENGRGGSKAVHERLRAGDLVKISRPRNHFPLARDIRRAVLIAGGIGVTPIKAMAHELEARGVDYEMHYCARNAECAAFGDELRQLEGTGRLQYHFDGGDPRAGLDLGKLLATPADGTHVYYCGPGGFMKACADAASHWPKGTVHFEHFKAPEQPAKAGSGEAGDASGAFEVMIASTGQTVAVGPSQSIAEALSEAGVAVATSCCAGLCATCKVRYLEGEVEHNDFILNDDERGEFLTTCVSRATSKVLVLDL